MQQDLVGEISNKLSNFKQYIPKGRKLLEEVNSMEIEQFLVTLSKILKIEEDEIKKENLKPYVTDNYENGVRIFAIILVESIISYHELLKGYETYRNLLKQRHIAYGFYSSFNNGSSEGMHKYENILQEAYFKSSLYLGLVEFYENFYGKFSDNEEAIILLCKFYPNDIDLSKNTQNIIHALFKHIKNAGTPSDYGFAYKGIALIKQYIGNLPREIVDELLQRYELYRIINDKVYRNQIFTIINNSIISYEEKLKYKFSYLDSLLLANYMNMNLYKKYGGNDENLIPSYQDFHLNLSVKSIPLIKYKSTDDIFAYWMNGCSIDRAFIVDKKDTINISLRIDKEKIWINYINKPNNNIELKFKYTDWMLDTYQSNEIEQKLQDFVFETNNGENKIVYNHLTFSLLYLSNYRGVSEQCVDFDHKFTYDKIEKKFKIADGTSPSIPHFYGKKIYSLSCIVGKNGTGKTSTVDFLKGTFFKLLRLISEYNIICKNGYIREEDYENYSILDKGCEFVVVFHLASKAYYLTNIEAKVVKGARPFNPSDYRSINELSKVVYFSNMLSVNHDSLYEDENTQSKYKNSEKKLGESLNNFRQVDYSEVASFIQKRKAIDLGTQTDKVNPIINKDLCYQLTFLGYLTQEKLESYFDMPVDKEFILKSRELGEKMLLTVSHSLKDIIGGETQKLKQFLLATDAKIEYFSSGQYAKFSFLAKLYWFLEGHQKYINDFEGMIGDNVFSSEETLTEGETALIFIDEGELYYHPEWQRSYIKTLIDNIHDTERSSKLQVVITTNSPFIISDILKEDITYLSEEEKDFESTFGQNIHKLLKDNFFMSYTIGEYSREVIENIMNWLCEEEEGEDNISKGLSFYFGEEIETKDYYKKILCLIGKIGEPLYRQKLLDMLNKSKFKELNEYEALLLQKSEIEDKLEILRRKEKV